MSHWIRRILSSLVIGLFAFASPALANVVSSASATLPCGPSQGTLLVSAYDLDPTQPFSITYTFTLTPVGGGAPQIITGTEPLTLSPTCLPPNLIQPDCINNLSITVPGAPTGDWLATGFVVVMNTTDGALAFCDDDDGTNLFQCTVSPLNGVSSPSGAPAVPALLDCPAVTGGCPATFGFWKNCKKHPFPASVQASGLTIGGVTYTPGQLYTILGQPGGGNAVRILGVQLVAALLNVAAGGQDNPTADSAIADAENALMTNSLNLLTSTIKPSSTLGKELTSDAGVLNDYNSANSGMCSNEGSDLTLGSFGMCPN
jgi:hypothetical protein